MSPSFRYPGDNGLSIQQIINNTASKAAFIHDLIAGAHAQQATGVNFDWETGFPFGVLNPFLTELAQAMHSATPPLGLSFDAGSLNPEGTTVPWCTPTAGGGPSGVDGGKLAPLDRWITMQTYTGSLPGFVNGLEQALNCTGDKMGVGASPAGLKLSVPPQLFCVSWCPVFEFRGASRALCCGGALHDER